MDSTSRIEIEKFNGQNFELWNLKMEDLLIDRHKWILIDSGTTPLGIKMLNGAIIDVKGVQ